MGARVYLGESGGMGRCPGIALVAMKEMNELDLSALSAPSERMMSRISIVSSGCFAGLCLIKFADWLAEWRAECYNRSWKGAFTSSKILHGSLSRSLQIRLRTRSNRYFHDFSPNTVRRTLLIECTGLENGRSDREDIV